ncbi:hypothetical protein BOTBODRAFT_36026 [Botryobasidium botryosum FD-172 SS1]|uniref:Spindle pole body component n=1 Tax=Botryobasidium botryosum (strain FD-172 SS1) TaxID=930990 RepID=A0A067M4K9_BOTB1|nr:hypothetical protein BOTBODRAFT_36026 [Botryobasidium botryosum FD-172 SS1]
MSSLLTPRPSSRTSRLTLSTKQINKIAGTIASVRATRGAPPRSEVDEDLDEDEEDVNGNDMEIKITRRTTTSTGRGRESIREQSFIAESSFVRAPLNSRVAVQPSPRAKKSSKGKAREESLKGVPIEIQEAFILEDLLFVLMGIPGTYITHHPDYNPEEDDLDGAQFVVSNTLDLSLRDLVDRILPLAKYYTAIAAFIERRSHLDFGLVNHALCASIRDMLKDYLTLVSQLEHAFISSSTFSLQKLFFYIHPTMHTLATLFSLTSELVHAEDPEEGDSDIELVMEEEDEEERRRNEELGLGGEGLKALLGEMKGSGGGGGIVKGGEVVAVLWERMMNTSGDPTAHQLYRKLLRDASRPYTQMLTRWIKMGHLSDPYDEFMVKESKFINRGTLEMDYTDEYWDRRYTLRDGSTISGPTKRHQGSAPATRGAGGRLPGGACIPPLLDAWKHKILLAGKYLNVIRECGIETREEEGGVPQDEECYLDDDQFYTRVEDAYQYANRTLLQLLLKDQSLVPRLRSLKYYFFLAQSSFLTHFLDLAHSELRKSSKSASIVKLQSLLYLSLNMNFNSEEVEFREDIKVTMASSGLYEWLLKVVSVSGAIGGEDGEWDIGVGGSSAGGAGGEDGEGKRREDKDKDRDKKAMAAMDALSLDYTVKFPLSLVISRKTILRYQLLFRFLLHLKHVEQNLCSMWIDQKAAVWRTPVRGHPELEKWRARVFLLRARMLTYVQQILAFATFEVLEPNWRKLEEKLTKVQTVDQLLKDHVDFLDTCLKECMLTSSKLLRVLSRLLQTCSTFALYTSTFTKSANQALSTFQNSGEDPGSVPMDKRWDFLFKFEQNFNHSFKVHLDCVQYFASSENVALLALVVRLNNVRVPS